MDLLVSEEKKVGDMPTKEPLIETAVYELMDPDCGLTLREEVEEELRESLISSERIPVEKVAEALALKW